MAKKGRRKQRSSGGFSVPSFIAGIVVGCLASILLAATAVPVLDNYEPDTAAFPEIDAAASNYEYEFPDILESSAPSEPAAPPVAEAVVETLEVEGTAEEIVEAPATAVETEPEITPTARHFLQAGSFEQQRHADVFRATLMLRGYKANTTVVEIPNVGPRYRVVVGPYTSEAEAVAAIGQLKAENVEAILL